MPYRWWAGFPIPPLHYLSLLTLIYSTPPETEKYAHVTFFFNGGVEKQFDGEDRELIPSPKVATYDKQPEMSAHGVAEKVAETVKEGKYEFVMCNFAPPDMVCLSRFPITFISHTHNSGMVNR